MLGNLKDFISVVQDGLSSSNNLRQTLQEVQKVKNIFREKPKSVNEGKVNYGAGGGLLEKYQENWAEIHKNAEDNAKAADEVDKIISEVHQLSKSRLRSAQDMANNLAYLPNLTVAVAECRDSLKNIQELMKAVEDDLVEFEDFVERNKMEKWRLDHHYHFSHYKEKKLASLEEIRSQLARENTERSCERERRQLAELQTRQEHSNIAFQVDVAKYLVTGNVPNGPPTKPTVSLDQIQLDDDNTDLEKFLDS